MNQLINQIDLQIVVVLASLDEQVRLDVRLHLLHRGDEVIVPPVHLNYIVVTFHIFKNFCCFSTSFSRRGLVVWGTQEPKRSGNSRIRSSLILSFIGPKIITGLQGANVHIYQDMNLEDEIRNSISISLTG